MSTRVGRLWQDFRAWRATRKAWYGGHAPAPEPKLNVFETFTHLGTLGRTSLIFWSFVAYAIAVNGTFSANVMPYAKKFFGELYTNGVFDHVALTSMLSLTGSVLLLTLSAFYVLHAKSYFVKFGLIVTSVGLALTNVNNNCVAQHEARTAHYSQEAQKAALIAKFQATMDDAERAWRAVPAHETVSKARVDEAKTELETIKASAEAECKRSLINRGVVGDPRGPKCEGLESDRKKQSEKVERLIANYDLTVQAEEQRAIYNTAKANRDAEGVVLDEKAKEKATGKEPNPFWSLWAHVGLMSTATAVALTEDAPTIDGIVQELQAWFFAPIGVSIVFWFHGLLVSHRTEAERRIVENAEAVAEKLAAATSKVVLSAAPQSPLENARDRVEMEADNEEAVLGIEGDALPAFAESPQTIHEHVAAAHLKADPDKNFDRKARRRIKNKDSVSLWRKERTTDREGREMWQDELFADYKRWCDDMNLIPEEKAAFGKELRRLVGDDKFKFMPSRKYKYFDVGLKPYLKAVAA